jgi:broad specificity phosphatase PhoE
MNEPSQTVATGTAPEKPLQIFLVRHGQALPDDSGHVLGPHLSELGTTQANAVGRRLRDLPVNRIYSSDLFRANETAAAICKYKNNFPCTVLQAIREISPFHFMPRPSLLDFDMKHIVRSERRPIRRFLDMLRKTHKQGERLVIVAHGNLIRTILPMFGGFDPRKSILLEMNNSSVTIVDVWPSGEAVVKLANCVSHLTPEQIT